MSERVPKLRFKEFSGEWEEKRLGDIGEIITGNTPKTDIPENYGNKILFVSPADISESRYIYNTNKKLSQQGALKARLVKSNSILVVCIGSTIGKIAQNTIECATNQQINSIIPNEQYDNDFIYSVLELNEKNIKQLSGNHAVPIINKTEFSNMEIFVPKCRNEQQKIANTLSSLDNLIEAQEKKVEALKKHKKGLMQQLFPQEGEKTPKLRFKEFSGEWEEKRLEEIADITMGSSPKSNFYNEDKKGIPLLQGNADIKNRKSNPRIYTTQVTKECNKEDILLSVRAPVGAIAKSKHNACIGRGFSSIRVKENNYQEWLYQWLLQFEDKWSNISQGGTFDSVNSSDIKNLKIYIPKDPNEQQKIANTLSSLDNLIEAREKKVNALKKHKKGLMQQMFVSEES